MQKAVPTGNKSAKNHPQTAQAQSRSSQHSGQGPEHLAQLAAMANSSSRVQTQLKVAQELQNSSQVEAQRNLAAEITAASPVAAQLKRLEEKPAQTKGKHEEKKPAQTKGKHEEKKPAQKIDDPAQAKSREEKHPGQMKAREKEKPRQAMFAGRGAPAQLEQAPDNPNRTGLPDQLKAGVEGLSGRSLDDVKVHYNSDKPAQLNALAYAQGTDIHVAPGQEKHLPHEAWHIVQQKEGRVRPTMQMKSGIPINDEAGLEHEADVMGARAFTVSEGKVQRKVDASGEVAQRTLRIQSAAGKFTYVFGKDFKRDHIGGQDDAIATLRQRWRDDRITSPVTVIQELDGDLEATDATPASPYGFAITIDVTGYTASWNARNEPVAVAVSNVVLSGYIKGKVGLITHISASD